MKINFTCPKCGGHVLTSKTTYEVQKEYQLIGLVDGTPVYDDDPAKEGYWESAERESFECGNPKCQAPVNKGVGDAETIVEIGLEEGWIQKVEE